jgi:hypothetical protein
MYHGGSNSGQRIIVAEFNFLRLITLIKQKGKAKGSVTHANGYCIVLIDNRNNSSGQELFECIARIYVPCALPRESSVVNDQMNL